MSTTLVRFLLAAALAAALAAPSSAATWGPPIPLSDTVAGTDSVQLVAGSDGRVLAVWSYRLGNGVSGVDAVSRRPDGRWGPRRAFGTFLPVSGGPSRASGVGASLTGMAAFGADRWLGLAIATSAAAHRRSRGGRATRSAPHTSVGVLPEEPWAVGPVAAFRDGGAVIAWATMRPRRRAGSQPAAAGRRRRARLPTGFGAPRRISPLPPGPPYGGGLGPALSATALTTAAGGRRTVVVAWQRTGRIEARISRDRGRTYGPVRYLGPSPEAFPSLDRPRLGRRQGADRLGRARGAGPDARCWSPARRSPPRARPSPTRVLERSAPLDLSAPQALRPVRAPDPGRVRTARRRSPPGRRWWTAAPPCAARAWRASR